MKSYLFSHPLKKVIQIVLLLALLFLSFGPGGTGVAYAAPPVHDDFDNAKLIDDLIYFGLHRLLGQEPSGDLISTLSYSLIGTTIAGTADKITTVTKMTATCV